jgi:hypothetical protein
VLSTLRYFRHEYEALIKDEDQDQVGLGAREPIVLGPGQPPARPDPPPAPVDGDRPT